MLVSMSFAKVAFVVLFVGMYVCLCLFVFSAVACEREVEGDLFIWDMGEGLGFKPGAFDGAISVSALQWLCNADRKDHHPPRRLHSFFSSLYACLASAVQW